MSHRPLSLVSLGQWRCVIQRMLLILFAIAQFGISPALADDPLIPQRCHVWGGFEPGAWTRMTISVENYADDVRTVVLQRKETRILRSKSAQGYTLEIAMDVAQPAAGQQAAQPAESVTREFPWFVSAEALIAADEIKQGDLEIAGRKWRCRLFEYRTEVDGRVRTHQDHFHAEHFPFFLRRVVAEPSDREDRPFNYQATTEIVQEHVAVELGSRLVDGVETRTTVLQGDRRIQVLEILAPEVPGGLVSKRTTEWDENGQIIRREVAELEDYSLSSSGEPAARGPGREIGLRERLRLQRSKATQWGETRR